MPYKNIVFVKLEKRLLNDHRWYMLSEPAQLIYVKLILLAAETYNKIPLNDNVLREALRSRLDLKSFQDCLIEIETNFPKLRKNKHFRYFAEFETKTNYIPKREIPGKSLGLPKVGAEEEIEKEKEIEKEVIIEIAGLSLKTSFLETLKKIYPAIDIEGEIRACVAWHSINNKRYPKVKWERAITNWLKKTYENKGIVGVNIQPQFRRP
jgi:hypothetical protein